MIRLLAVPPFEALDPLLPHRAGSDPETREAVRRILDDVLERGDEAVREYTCRFDGVELGPREWELDAAGWHMLAAGHLGIHRTQIERIIQGLAINS